MDLHRWNLRVGNVFLVEKNTRTLIRMAKRADKTKLDKNYKALGKKMFEYIKTQDSREPEYVEMKD